MIVPSKVSRSFLASRQRDALVCVVDDDEAIRRSFSRLFRSVRLPAETFASAQDYLERISPDLPSCLVLDVCLPGLDGLELQQALANREEQIVFITGHGDVPMCAQAMKAGAVDFLTKPVDDEVLLEAVSRALERSAEFLTRKAERASARAKLDRLTPREFEVMRSIIAGLLNKQIAARAWRGREDREDSSRSSDGENGRDFRGGIGSAGRNSRRRSIGPRTTIGNNWSFRRREDHGSQRGDRT